jgi:hypothetical protein
VTVSPDLVDLSHEDLRVIEELCDKEIRNLPRVPTTYGRWKQLNRIRDAVREAM